MWASLLLLASFWQPQECHFISQCVLHSPQESAGSVWHLPQASEWWSIPFPTSTAQAALQPRYRPPSWAFRAQHRAGHVWCQALERFTRKVQGTQNNTWLRQPSKDLEDTLDVPGGVLIIKQCGGQGLRTCPSLPGSSACMFALNGLNTNTPTFL